MRLFAEGCVRCLFHGGVEAAIRFRCRGFSATAGQGALAALNTIASTVTMIMRLQKSVSGFDVPGVTFGWQGIRGINQVTATRIQEQGGCRGILELGKFRARFMAHSGALSRPQLMHLCIVSRIPRKQTRGVQVNGSISLSPSESVLYNNVSSADSQGGSIGSHWHK